MHFGIVGRKMASKHTTLQKKLTLWYRKHHRKGLPWRQTKDPYRIWVSETMLQQTQVSTVIPYYERFVKTFPTVKHLARAPLPKVLDAWSGLGYYSRARNFHTAAQQVLKDHQGKVPDSPEALLKLKGIGRYTAGAIASIAYSQPAPILDGNVMRVLARLFCIRGDLRTPTNQKKLWQLAAELVADQDPGTLNQAMMELGALVCTPRTPSCSACPLKRNCVAQKRGLQKTVPPVRASLRKKRINYACAVIQRGHFVLLARRPFEGLLGGLWEFPGGELHSNLSETKSLTKHLKERLGICVRPEESLAQVRQLLTHRELVIRAFAGCMKPQKFRLKWYTEVRWIPVAKLKATALTAGMRKCADQVFFSDIMAAR